VNDVKEKRRKCYKNGGLENAVKGYGIRGSCYTKNDVCDHLHDCYWGRIERSEADGGGKMSKEEIDEYIDEMQSQRKEFERHFEENPILSSEERLKEIIKNMGEKT